MGADRFISFTVSSGESDLWIGYNFIAPDPTSPLPAPDATPHTRTDNGMAPPRQLTPTTEDVRQVALEALASARADITGYAATHPGFLTALEPLEEDAPEGVETPQAGHPAARVPVPPAGGLAIGEAVLSGTQPTPVAAAHTVVAAMLDASRAAGVSPPVVAAMLDASRAAGVGPMAAVAGAIAEAVGTALAERFGPGEYVVENGGDLWILVTRPLSVSVYAGLSSLSEKVAVQVDGGRPVGLACSSGTVGPSLSFGRADAAVVIAGSAALADAWATALGNRIHSAADLEPAVGFVAMQSGGVADRRDTVSGSAISTSPATRGSLGALAILGDRMAAAGDIRIGPYTR